MDRVAHPFSRVLNFLRAEWRYLLVLVLCVSTAFWPLFVGRFYAVGDMRDVFIPLEHFFSTSQRQGFLPAWNHQAAWGFPVIAAAQIGFFYPWLLLVRFLPLPAYLSLTLLVHMWALGVGMYVWLRAEKQSAPAALLGSLAFTLSGFIIQHVSHLNITLAVAWLPWQLLTAHYLAHAAPRTWRQLALCAAVLGVPFLVGQIQIPLLLAVFTSVYFFWTTARAQRAYRPALFFLAGTGLLAIALVAVQLLPTFELVRYSSRGVASDFDIDRANQHSFPLYHLPTLLFPRFFGSDTSYWGKRLEIEYGFFIGVIPVLLAAGIAVRHWRHYRFWLATAVCTFLLALGNLSPVRLVGLEPSLWFFSAPARWLLFTTLALSVLAGYGFDALQRGQASARKIFTRATASIVALLLLANVALIWKSELLQYAYTLLQQLQPTLTAGRSAEYYVEKIQQLADSVGHTTVSLQSPYTALTLTSLAIFIFFLQRPRARKLLVATVAAELAIVAATTTPTQPWSDIVSPPHSIAALPAAVRDNQARLFTQSPNGDTGALLTNPATRPTAAARAQQKELLVPLLHTQFNLSGIAWPASLDFKAQSDATSGMVRDQEIAVADAENLNVGALLAPNALPLTSSIEPTTAGDITIYPLQPAARAAVRLPDGSELPVRYTTSHPGKIVLLADTSQAGQLIVRDSWYPGWRASVNGQPVRIVREAPFFMSLPLPAGNSHIELTFVSKTIYGGLLISLAALAFVVAAASGVNLNIVGKIQRVLG